MSQQSHSSTLGMKTYIHQEANNVYSSFSQKLKIAKMSINQEWGIIKTMTCALFMQWSTTRHYKEQINTGNNVEESQKHQVKWNNPDITEYVFYSHKVKKGKGKTNL